MAGQNPPYSKGMRERAKAEGWGLGTIDVISSDGARMTTWGPAPPEKEEFLRWASACSLALDPEFLPNMKRIYLRAKKRQDATKDAPDGE